MHNKETYREPQDSGRGWGRWSFATLLVALSGFGAGVQAQDPVVHVVLFYSPTCPHCEWVIENHLAPLRDQYGDSLVILALDTSTDYGSGLFQAAMDRYRVPRGDWGVPFVIVQDQIMTGSVEIPQRLPALIEEGFAARGIDLPDFPALIAFLDVRGALRTIEPGPRYIFQDPSSRPVEEPATGDPPDPIVVDEAAREERATEDPPDSIEDQAVPVAAAPADPTDSTELAEAGGLETAPDRAERAQGTVAPNQAGGGEEPQSAPVAAEVDPGEGVPEPADLPLELDAIPPASGTLWARFARDRTGGTLALLLLVGMIVSLTRTLDPRKPPRRAWPDWAMPALIGVGLFVALYLSYVEVTGNPATCGPIGDCNTVQQSSYARLFGVLPIGVLGVAAYASLLSLWLIRRLSGAPIRWAAAFGFWAVTFLGTVFSVYLTFLEPFVIGAVCMWCLTSALVMTLLLLTSSGPAARAIEEWRG